MSSSEYRFLAIPAPPHILRISKNPWTSYRGAGQVDVTAPDVLRDWYRMVIDFPWEIETKSFQATVPKMANEV